MTGTRDMGNVILYIAASIDGYIARENGAVDWLDMVEVEGEDYGYVKFYDTIDSLVMGSTTYEQVLGFGDWPYPGKQTYVLTGRALETVNPDITITADPPEKVVADMTASGHENTWLVGGGRLTVSILSLDLVDEIILTIIPVILGNGIRLFPESFAVDRTFELLSTESFPSGLVQLHYRKSDTISSEGSH
ncbi:dihydrofolate reductase family protein [Candidatus Latescibacterota bacterium]